MKPAPVALEERLIEFGAGICKALRQMPCDVVGGHLTGQLVRCATSPAANYAEACAAESRRDFLHKMRLCLKELRETSVWLRFSQRLCCQQLEIARLSAECSELIAIFVTSINTARKAANRR
ncbi:MAG: four helix bundle protein [Gemmatimonadales bacterium]